MNVELKLTSEDDGYVVKNLWPLYVHEVSEFASFAPNAHGVLLDDESVETLAAQGETLAPWWRTPRWLFPYLILADGRPAGFNLISSGPYLPKGVELDFVVHEFFVLHAFRGRGVARAAAAQGFARHRGRWEVVTYPSHARAIAFWRRAAGAATATGECFEAELDHPWGRKVVFRFDNRDGSAASAP